jgi:hypothetical protein
MFRLEMVNKCNYCEHINCFLLVAYMFSGGTNIICLVHYVSLGLIIVPGNSRCSINHLKIKASTYQVTYSNNSLSLSSYLFSLCHSENTLIITYTRYTTFILQFNNILI